MSRKTPGEVRARTCGTKSPSRSEALRFIDSSKSPSTVDGDLDESIKRSASDRLGDLVPQVRARTSPGVFRDMALLGLCLELSFSVLYCRTQANLPTVKGRFVRSLKEFHHCVAFLTIHNGETCNKDAKGLGTLRLFLIDATAFFQVFYDVFRRFVEACRA